MPFVLQDWCCAVTPVEAETIRQSEAIRSEDGWVVAYPATTEGAKQAAGTADRVSPLVLVKFQAMRGPDEFMSGGAVFITPFLPVRVLSVGGLPVEVVA